MLILASNSPRRKELLSLTGWNFRTCAVEVDESPILGETPQGYVMRLALQKARATGELLARGSQSTPCIIIAADTAVVDVEQGGFGSPPNWDKALAQGCFSILGKPEDEKEAIHMLQRLRNRSHRVYTAIALWKLPRGEPRSEVCISEVAMRAYSDEELFAYVASGDPLDKAGGYAIQHAGFHPVAQVTGCYANVVGLPLCLLAHMLSLFHFPFPGTLVQRCQNWLSHPCEVYWAWLGEI